MKNRLSYCDIIITHAHRYFFSKCNKNCRRDCACKTISPQGTVLRIGFLLPVILSSTPYCMIMYNMHTHEQIRARHRRIESDLEREEALHEKYAPLQKY